MLFLFQHKLLSSVQILSGVLQHHNYRFSFIKRIMQSIRKRARNYQISIFILCVIIATFIWVLIKLSSVYSTEFTFPVKYTNSPEKLILVNDINKFIQIGLEEQGFALARLKYFTRKKAFEINLSDIRIRKSGNSFIAAIPTNTWVQEMHKEFNIEGEILYSRPDTIIFVFEEEASKTVDVQANFKYSFKKQFYLYDSIRIIPEKVTISGLASAIDTISSIFTESTRFDGIENTFETKIKLYNPLPGAITLDPPSAGIIIPVEKFTESEITIPVSVPDNMDEMRIKIFPDDVTIVYFVALKDYRKVNAEMFKASVDLDNLDPDNDTKISVRIDAFPHFTRIKKIEPPEVEYLILK